MVIVPKSTIKFDDHVKPIPASVLALAGPHLLKSSLLVETNKPLSAEKSNAPCHPRILDPLHVALEEHLAEPLACEIGMDTQRVETYCLSVFIVADTGSKLVVCAEVFGIVHGVVSYQIGRGLGADDVTH